MSTSPSGLDSVTFDTKHPYLDSFSISFFSALNSSTRDDSFATLLFTGRSKSSGSSSENGASLFTQLSSKSSIFITKRGRHETSSDRFSQVKKIITGSCAGIENTLRETVENGLYKIVVADMTDCQDGNIDEELGVVKVTDKGYGQILV